MMSLVKNGWDTFRSTFWSEYVWLPPNVTWSVYENQLNGVKYAKFNDLYYSIITAVVLLCIRYTLERYLFTPIGLYFGLKTGRRKDAPSNAILEKVYVSCNGKINYKQVQGLAKQSDWTERQVERWLRQRMAHYKPTTLTRFTESAWRITFYFLAFVYGIYTLSDKPWMWESIHCFINYPHHSVSSTEWWYYNIELGFYLSLIISQFYDIQRKDFWQMFIHHIVTVMLLCFSWSSNLIRIGTLVLVIHDFADIPLEGAKLSRYMRSESVSNVVFAVFTVCWIVSRLGLLPYRVIAYSTYYALAVVPMFPAYYIFNALLCALQILHVIWTWLILRIAYNAIYNDGVKDLRESDDTTDCELSEEEVEQRAEPPASPAKASANGNGYIDGGATQKNGNNNLNNGNNNDAKSRVKS